jgi:hypothetical protein
MFHTNTLSSQSAPRHPRAAHALLRRPAAHLGHGAYAVSLVRSEFVCDVITEQEKKTLVVYLTGWDTYVLGTAYGIVLSGNLGKLQHPNTLLQRTRVSGCRSSKTPS